MTVNDVRAHAAKLLQDDQILPLEDAIGKMPMASLSNFKPAAEEIDDLLDRLDSATPDRGHILKMEEVV